MNIFKENLEQTTAKLNAEIISEIERITENAVLAERWRIQTIMQNKINAVENDCSYQSYESCVLRDTFNEIFRND